MPNYPTKALQEYVLKSDLIGGVLGVDGPPGPPGSAGPPGANGAAGASWTPVQSATAPAIVSTGTIATTAVTVARVSPTVDVTGIILAVGTIAGQQLVVLNESAFSITFAAQATSHVACAQLCVIPSLTHQQFVWNTVTGLWFPSSALITVAAGAGGTFGAGTFGAATFGG